MVFNTIVNWDDPTPAKTSAAAMSTTPVGRDAKP
jgi:hypothetical protein